MGQPIVVTEKPSSNPGVVRFETNRAITGMGHERYLAGTEIWGDRPPDELARRLFAHGSVAGVQVNSNMVTVDLARGRSSEGLKSIIENLYIYYPDQPTAASASASASDTADTAAPVPETDEALAPVPEVADAPDMAADPADATALTADDAPAADDVPAADDAPNADPESEADA